MSNQDLLSDLSYFIDGRLSNLTLKGEPLSINQSYCFSVSKLACKILRRLGYNCNVQRVMTILGNKKGKEVLLKQAECGKFDKQEVMDSGGWAIGIGTLEKGQTHYVIYFPDTKEIMDLTFGQASRPDKDIVCKPFWAGEDKLPKVIFTIVPHKRDSDWELQCLYYNKDLKEYFDLMIMDGYRTLKRFKI